mmetsp:Transcript_29820/g.54611  ORF Transcript_29820/g.54611 Transcript_29820/m.54611 type:complete len:389 (-) Transcript_29820:56-1222(-)
MPGPKMGARPPDFDESLVRQAPTFIRWMSLPDGHKLRYACRDFIRGHSDDEERLMRRIMIARRNNIRDHEMLKRARQTTRGGSSDAPEEVVHPVAPAPVVPSKRKAPRVVKEDPDMADASPVSTGTKKRRISSGQNGMSDEDVLREMDLSCVEGTRSYKTWAALEEGEDFTYNQRYTKGKEGHEWLLKKNIWRRMRYRRMNKKMVEKLKDDLTVNGIPPRRPVGPDRTGTNTTQAALASAAAAAAATQIVDHALLASAAAAATEQGTDEPSNDNSDNPDFVHRAVVDAAVAAAESYVKGQSGVGTTSHDESDAHLNAIAAMSVPGDQEDMDEEDVKQESDIKVNNPLDGVSNHNAGSFDGALDAAAMLANAVMQTNPEDSVAEEIEEV